MTEINTIYNYQAATKETFMRNAMIANLEQENAPIIYAALELNGEAGEVADIVKKKYIRDGNGNLNAETVADLEKEIGDCMFAIACLANELGLDMLQIARINMAKLRSRKLRGVIQGSGDNR